LSCRLMYARSTIGTVFAYTTLFRSARANPGKLNFASAGIGTTPHMAGELLKARAGIDMAHVPYKGAGPAMADLAAGQVQVGHRRSEEHTSELQSPDQLVGRLLLEKN